MMLSDFEAGESFLELGNVGYIMQVITERCVVIGEHLKWMC